MVNNLVRIVYILLALMVPGGFVFLAIGWVFKRLFGRYRLAPPPTLPLKSPSGEILCSVADWDRHARIMYPIRYFLTRAIPKASRRAVAAFKARFWPQPQSGPLKRSWDARRRAWVLKTPPRTP